MDAATALVSGALAGLAIALPLGAISVLLVQEAIRGGFRPGMAAAAGVASVDLLYCVLAVALGAVVAPLITRIEPSPGVVGGIALVAIAVIGLRRGLARHKQEGVVLAPRGSAISAFPVFFGLTLVNPATVVYFVAVTASLTDLHDDLITAGAFVVGVGAASFAWQSVIVTLGAVFGRRANARAQRATVVIGYVVVAVLGILLLIRAFV
ncbi:LysE family transporter [Microbacterium sp. BWT-B31]|uniref:LysE family transporter n=1 Tax=Microbacterium sp. BWT-B31 TaxID=3232072 RepID=UPI0035272FB2